MGSTPSKMSAQMEVQSSRTRQMRTDKKQERHTSDLPNSARSDDYDGAQCDENIESGGDTNKKLEVCLKRLQSIDYNDNQKVHECVDFVYEVTEPGSKQRTSAINKLASDGRLLNTFQKVLNSAHENGFKESVMPILDLFAIVVANCVDVSMDICDNLISSSIPECLLKCLSAFTSKQNDTGCGYAINDIIYSLLAIMHNVISKSDSAKSSFSALDALNVVDRYQENKDERVKGDAVLLQAYLMTEEQYEQMETNAKSIKQIISYLEDSLKHSTHLSSKYGFSSKETVQGLNKIAVSDRNKVVLVKKGVLRCYTTLMQHGLDLEELRLTVNGVWLLAFKCADDIKKEPGCIEALTKLTQHKVEDIRKQAASAFWFIESKTGHLQPPATQATTDDETGSSTEKKMINHVFLSYQWANQNTVIKLRDHLRSHNFSVWMDVDNMSGSILEAMGLAVEQASVVLICMSQKYKDSPNCRTEGEYSYTKKKNIIPVRMERGYTPDGWLGAMIGNKLYFDLSREDRFEGALSGIIKELDSFKIPRLK